MKRNVQALTKSLQSRLQEGESHIRRNWNETKNELPPYWRDTLLYWEDASQDLVRGFTGMFGQEGLVSLVNFCHARVSY